MTGYLPHTVAIGDKLRLTPYALNKQDNGSGNLPQALTGEVIYIHPRRRFAAVRFLLIGCDSTGHRVDKFFRECWPLEPDARRLAHKDPLPPKPAKPLTQRLQEKDWSRMTSAQIAEVLGTDARSVTTAIHHLAKRGINVPYKKMVDGRPKKRKDST